MTTDTAQQPREDPIGRELMRQAQLISQLRRDLDELASDTTDLAADVLARLDELGTRDTANYSPRAWTWKDIGPEAEKELWAQLSPWVAWLRSRYPLAQRIPGCWDKHPEIVEELTALWLAWQAAYTDPNASLTAAADWHDRWLPELLHRLQHGPHAIDCSETHRERPARSYAETG
jgi:hypothetical protein